MSNYVGTYICISHLSISKQLIKGFPTKESILVTCINTKKIGKIGAWIKLHLPSNTSSINRADESSR